jgi:hypothetical protein
MHKGLYKLTQLKWQLVVTALPISMLALCLHFPHQSRIDLSSLDRSTFITALSTLATILAIFCPLSIAWILFVSQQNKAERVTAYDLMESRLFETLRWLLSQRESADRFICLSLAFELDKLDLSDLPQTGWGDEFREYTEALESGLNDNDCDRREFFVISSTHFGYIEHLLNRLGLISIRQIIAELFIDTLAKGVGLVAITVFTLVASTLWYSDKYKPLFVLITSFCGIGATLLLFEVWIDLRRHYEEDLDFIEHENPTPKNNSTPRCGEPPTLTTES